MPKISQKNCRYLGFASSHPWPPASENYYARRPRVDNPVTAITFLSQYH